MSKKAQRSAEDWIGRPCRDTVTVFYGTATAVAFYMGQPPKVMIEAPSPTGDAWSRWVEECRVAKTDGEPSPGVYT